MKEIKLTRGMTAIVDDADYDALSKKRWYCTNHGYAARRSTIAFKKSKIQLMHREIMGQSGLREIDHINGNKLDNRRENLRFATKSQNMANRGKQSNNRLGAKGVTQHRETWGFRAEIMVNGDRKCLGSFRTKEMASMAYAEAAKELHGEFARQ